MINIAILNSTPDVDVNENIIKYFNDIDGVALTVYKTTGNTEQVGNINYVVFPESVNTLAKMHNYAVTEYAKTNAGGFLHVIEDNIHLLKSPVEFISDLHKMMNVFKLDTWFNTTSDIMNYLYKKYNPRMIIELDDPKYSFTGLKNIVFTSHANAYWIAYNMDNYSPEKYLFNDDFTVRMFFIIEFLARRKTIYKDSKTLNYMNMYPTVLAEQKTFELILPDNEKYSDEVLSAEHEKFKAMNIDTTPDNLIDTVLETMYDILNNK